jgi:hypothetical protein
MDLMTAAANLACDVHDVGDGVLVVPAVLPIHGPAEALALTVRQWLGVASA